MCGGAFEQCLDLLSLAVIAVTMYSMQLAMLAGQSLHAIPWEVRLQILVGHAFHVSYMDTCVICCLSWDERKWHLSGITL